MAHIEAPEEQTELVRELTKPQRRVLGVLIEKGFTTPEYYPLTLKALTTGCNQKSNRSPVADYSEDTVEDTLDQLRQLGLVAVVHTDSGRAARYRHYMRHRYPFSETQLAIIAELLLRGRQQLGELRSRASRMRPIESQDDLRSDLKELQEQGFVQTSGPLERRGIEVDHAFYPADEQTRQPAFSGTGSESAAAATSASSNGPEAADVQELQALCASLSASREELTEEVRSLREQVEELSDVVGAIRRDLGV